MNDPHEHLDPDRALLSSRVLWAALLGGQVVFIIVIAVLQGQATGPTLGNPAMLDTLFWIAVAMVVLGVPVGYVLRMQMYKRYWERDVIRPRGYVTGNLLLWAVCEGASMFGLVLVMLAGDFWPWVLPSAAAMAVQVINFPDGKPMFAGGA